MESTRRSEFSEVEFVARDTEVGNDVGDDAAWHVARMPREGDEPVGAERVGVVPMTPGGAEQFAADLAESPFQLAAIVGGIFSHGSGGEDELVAERGRNGASGFQQRFEMGLGSLLKTQRGFASVAAMSVTARQQRRFRNPHAVFILSQLHFRERNNHGGARIARRAFNVKRRFDG